MLVELEKQIIGKTKSKYLLFIKYYKIMCKTDRNGQKQTKTESNWQKWTDMVRNGQKLTETDSSRDRT